MTILALIGNRINEKDKINTLSDVQEQHTFSTNFFLLYDNHNCICRSMKAVINNSFIGEGSRVLIVHLYTRIRKIYGGFTKFARLWRWYNARNASLDTDLYMNSLDSFKSSHTICLLQAGTKYNFRITDLLNIWSIALASCCSFHPRPKLPKNPYTNLEFNLGQLASTFLQAMRLGFNIPILITLFWQNSLDLEKFRIEAYPILKEEAVKNYISDNSSNTLFYDIVNMVSALDRHLSNRNISMDLLPSVKEAFIKDVTPFLKKYLLSKHTCNPLKKRRFKKEAISELKKYFIDNPLAGRRVVYPSWRQRGANPNPTTGSFTFGNNTILGDSVFVFGSGMQAAPDVPYEDDPANAPQMPPEDEIEMTSREMALGEADESYNEVLDDSDDSDDTIDQSVLIAADSRSAGHPVLRVQEEAVSLSATDSSSESDSDDI